MRNSIRKHYRNIAKGIVVILGIPLLSAPPIHARFGGFYAGASLGYLNQNTHINAQQNPANANGDIYKSINKRGLPSIEVFFGWGKTFGQYLYGGIEGQLDRVLGREKKIGEDTNFAYLSGRKGIGVSVLARLGYLLTPSTLLYGGIGMKKTRFTYNLWEKADGISAPFSQQFLNVLTEVGMEINYQRNLFFRFSYSFVPKKDLSRKAKDFPIKHIYRENGSLKASIEEHTTKFGLYYSF